MDWRMFATPALLVGVAAWAFYFGSQVAVVRYEIELARTCGRICVMLTAWATFFATMAALVWMWS